ncbi:MAG: efflux RND transporter periplasmic adaptor subunit [Bacteroidota bacterium]
MEAPTNPTSVLTRPIQSGSSGGGEGMDRRAKKRRLTPKRIAMVVGGLAILALVVWGLFFQDTRRTLNVERDKITVATIDRGTFQEYVSVTGNAQPIKTVYLDAVVGGQVEERYVEEGAMVSAGQPLLRLSNDQMELNMANSEAALEEQVDRFRNTRLNLDQNALRLQQQLVETNYQITRLEREHTRNEELFDRGAIAQQEYERIRDELDYQRRLQELTRESYRQDSLARAIQLGQIQESLGRLRQNLVLVRRNAENLTVRAPITGQLSAMDVEIGELMTQGSRIGQVDQLDGYKVRVPIDEFWIARVARGQRGTVDVSGETYTLDVNRVYPEVSNGRFEVDMLFVGETPRIRRGQSLRIRLELGDSEEALLVPRGGFYQTTGGNWIFAVSEDGGIAEKRTIRLGRQNPQFFEVLDGLQPGDRVVTSGYDTFGEAEKLNLE